MWPSSPQAAPTCSIPESAWQPPPPPVTLETSPWRAGRSRWLLLYLPPVAGNVCPHSAPTHKEAHSLFLWLMENLRLEATCTLQTGVVLSVQCLTCFSVCCQPVSFGRILIQSPFLKSVTARRFDPPPPWRHHTRSRWGPPLGQATPSPGARGQSCACSPPHSKLLHKRDSDKVDAQEENFLPKYQRVKDLCQRAEYQTACEQLGQVRMLSQALGRGQCLSCPSFSPRGHPS